MHGFKPLLWLLWLSAPRCLGIIALALALASSGCQSTVRPAPENIGAWTTRPSQAQPEDAFAVVYARSERKLVFIGAKHENNTHSLTFQLIADAHASFRVDTFIVEGPPYSRGTNSKKLFDWVQRQTETNGFVEGGETIPTVRGAIAQGANVWGGEPDDFVIRDSVLSQGFSPQDLLGFYTLRSVPQ